jgi:UDPglucose--hexose-1-phosphate uridylyltransferase
MTVPDAGPPAPEAEVRVDPLSGAPTIVIPGRQGRPNLESGPCPFCPGGLEAPESYRTRWFPNRWPSMPDGRCEIHLFSPDHRASLGSLEPSAVEAVLGMWADRTAAQGDRPDVDYVLVFENRGAEVGATVRHPHGQLYAYAEVPPVPRRELRRTGPCPVCAGPAATELLVAGGKHWRAWVPAAAGFPYELLVAPAGHAADLGESRATFPDAAVVLGSALGALDRMFGAPAPYMLWVHQRPTDGREWPAAHVHVHVTPLWRAPGVPRFVAAAEVGGGVFLNPVDPVEAAAALRSALR